MNKVFTPQVEVGQLWKDESSEFEVIAVSDAQVVRQYAYGAFEVDSIDDFLAKFERVS